MWFNFYLVLMSFHIFTPWITFLHIECTEATKASLQKAASFNYFPSQKNLVHIHSLKMFGDSSQTACTSIVWCKFVVWLKYKGNIEPWTLLGANPPSQQTLVVDLRSLPVTTCLTVFIDSYRFNGYIYLFIFSCYVVL